jgi:N-acetylglutamate synthase-like GNAT family acetyltransferase
MPIKIIDHGSADYQKMVDLRMEILRKPLGLTFSDADLEKEKDDILIGAFEEEDLMACCILTKVAEDTCKLRQMAVRPKIQGTGLGAAMMNYAEQLAKDAGFKKMVMNARKTAKGFYEKLGYETKGDEFAEVTLPHFYMQKNII